MQGNRQVRVKQAGLLGRNILTVKLELAGVFEHDVTFIKLDSESSETSLHVQFALQRAIDCLEAHYKLFAREEIELP